jgi:hypothetical protein
LQEEARDKAEAAAKAKAEQQKKAEEQKRQAEQARAAAAEAARKKQVRCGVNSQFGFLCVLNSSFKVMRQALQHQHALEGNLKLVCVYAYPSRSCLPAENAPSATTASASDASAL